MRPGAIKPPGVHYSPSQCITFDACPRKWGLETLFGFEGEEDEAAAWGTEGHTYVEGLLRNNATIVAPQREGVAFRMTRYFDECLRPLLAEHGLKPGDPTLLVEHQVTEQIEIDGPNGPVRFWWTFIDLTFRAKGEFEFERYDAVAHDHKTHRSMRWAKSRWELARDLQMLTCAKFSPACKDATRVLLVLGQVQREGPIEHQLTRAVVTREAIETTWYERVLPLVREMEKVRRGASSPGDIRTPPEGPGLAPACKAYGGCEFVEACKLAEAGRADWDVPIAHLRKKKEGEVLNPPDSTRRPEGSPWHVIHNEESGLQAALNASVPEGKKVNFLDELLKKSQSAEPTPAAVEEIDDDDAKPSPVAKSALDGAFGKLGAVPKTEIAEEESKTPVVPEAQEPPKAKRGRPPKKAKLVEEAPPLPSPEKVAKDVEELERQGVATPEATYVAPLTVVAAVESAPFTAGAGIEWLFIDCAPFEGFATDVMHFSEFIAPVLADLRTLKIDAQGRLDPERGYEWKDWRMIPYGQGAAYIRVALESCALPEALCIESRDPLALELLATLRVRSRRVVQGLR